MSTKDLFEKYVNEMCSKCINQCKEFTLCNITIHGDNKERKAKCNYYKKVEQNTIK